MLHYHNKNNGVILLTVLIFMQILILLNWCVLERAWLSQKSSKNFMMQDKLQYSSKQILSEIELMLTTQTVGCMIPITNSIELVHKPLTWWQSAITCSGNFQEFHYYYVVEPLIDDECAMIDETGITASYLRITLLIVSNSYTPQLFLQSTSVKPSIKGMLYQCHRAQHRVQLGRQAWRELDF